MICLGNLCLATRLSTVFRVLLSWRITLVVLTVINIFRIVILIMTRKVPVEANWSTKSASRTWLLVVCLICLPWIPSNRASRLWTSLVSSRSANWGTTRGCRGYPGSVTPTQDFQRHWNRRCLSSMDEL